MPNVASVVALPVSDSAPEPLRPLGSEGTKLWERIWTSGARWISQSTDIELVQLVCEAMDERTQLRVTVLRGSDWRDRVALRSLEGDLRGMLSTLGMTPTDRTRLGVAEVRAESVLEQLRSRAATR